MPAPVLPAVIAVLILCAAAALVALSRRVVSEQARDGVRLSESMRRLQEQDSGFSQESLYRDSSSTVDHYLPDTRIRRRSTGHGFWKKG